MIKKTIPRSGTLKDEVIEIELNTIDGGIIRLTLPKQLADLVK